MAAPSKFLGDWSGLSGFGKVSYDIKINVRPGDGQPNPFEMWLIGPGGSLRWTSPGVDTTTDWITIQAKLDPEDWTVDSGSFEGVLADVQQFRIRVRMFSNTDFSQVNGFDNVVVAVPEPTTSGVLAGVAGMFLRRRKR
ncbi:MAG: PEP-CTERM sorting domain-containing protein [Armatimonadetes bacterium]|nr:PEP-CTERM sorting domain-containing protein [Armatimonadota bacterium]MCZ7580839.1 PEP-CTERM sorting domain-containing protein [Fimbriimonadaceae bacterium]NOG38270.1 PEP-CTERM sorting domain-containing protein [Armatimonadota bacterium]GIK32730.1 MAG: hypothetical protein BroJett009_17220 [Armatimonadota bacterium]